MAQYINKDALVAEIKRRRKLVSDPILSGDDLMIGERNALFNLLSFIDTLEVKEENFIWNNARTTVPEDSINQIICLKEDGLAVSTVGKIVNGTIKWAYLDDLLNTNSFNTGVKEVDLDKELEDWLGERVGKWTGKECERMCRHFFELGLKAQKGK